MSMLAITPGAAAAAEPAAAGEAPFAALAASPAANGSPYPGLRPFSSAEPHLFFGREEQIDALLDRLHNARLVAVVGASGAGKSSLVRAGLIPALEAGFVVAAGANWRFAVMKPGNAPLQNLVRALDTAGVLSEVEGAVLSANFALAELKQGPLGLIRLVAEARLPKDVNLLLVVDQFEEIFRFRSEHHGTDETDSFVELVLNAVRQREVPIYVVFTMRSDFIGECARFHGLPEALNDNQFLTPRPTREQLRAAIRGPARVYGGEVEATLVTELINQVGDDPDQLPLIQHLLMRLWQTASKGTGAPLLTRQQADGLGGLKQALNNHAEQIFTKLPPAAQRVAELMFKRLVGGEGGRRDTRRPTAIGEIVDVINAAGADAALLPTVIAAFRDADCNFLMPPAEVPIDTKTTLDISHEALIRRWCRLQTWEKDETATAEELRWFVDEAQRWKKRETELLTGKALARARTWHRTVRPTWPWACRYFSREQFDGALDFIEQSNDQALLRRRVKDWSIVASVIAILLVAGAGWYQQSVSRSRQLAAAAAQELNRDFELALLLARRAAGIPEADRDSLLARLVAWPMAKISGRDDVVVSSLRRALAQHVPSRRIDGTMPARICVRASQDEDCDIWLWSTLAPDSVSPDGNSMVLPMQRTTGLTGDTVYSAAIIDINAAIETAVNLTGHSQPIGSARFSPDGRHVLTTSADGTARVWNADSGRELFQLKHAQAVNFANFDGNGTRIVTASDDGTAAVWDAETGASLALLENGSGDPVSQAIFGPDGKTVITTTTTMVSEAKEDFLSQVYRWPATGGDSAFLCTHLVPRQPPAFSPDGGRLYCVEEIDNKELEGKTDRRRWVVRIRNAATGESISIVARQRNRIIAFALSKDGKRLATAATDNTAQIWRDTGTGDVWERGGTIYGHESDILAMSFNRDGSRLITASGDRTARIWDVSSGKEIIALRGHSDRVTSAIFVEQPGKSQTDLYIVTASDDHSARRWDLRHRSAELLPSASVKAVAVMSAGDRIAAVKARSIEMRPFSTTGKDPGSELPAPWPMDQQAISVFANKLVLTRAGESNTYAVWDTTTGRKTATFLTASTKAMPVGSADGQSLAYPGESGIMLIDPRNGHERQQFPASSCKFERARDVAATGRLVAAVCDGGNLQVWSTETGEELALPVRAVDEETTFVRFSPDGRLMMTLAKDGRVRVWRVEDEEPFREIYDLYARAPSLVAAAFSPNGDYLATFSKEGLARIWDLTAENQLDSVRLPKRHEEAAAAIGFAADNKTLLILSEDELYRWTCVACGDEAGVIRAAQAREIDRPLRPKEQARYGLSEGR